MVLGSSISIGGSNSLLVSGGDVDIFASGDLDDYFTFSVTSDRPLFSATGNYLVLGKDATSGHSLDADDILFGEDIEVDGMSWLDGGVTIGISGNVLDDIAFTLGTTLDSVFYHRSATLTADTALTGVLVGTPDTSALAANSLINSNVTTDGDYLLALSDGGNSKQMIFGDGSTGILHLGKPGTPGVATSTGDVYVAGRFEVDGVTYLEGGTNAYTDFNLYTGDLKFQTDARNISAPEMNDNYLLLLAYENDPGGSLQEVARLQGAANPYFSMGGSQEFKFYNSGTALFGSIVTSDAATIEIGAAGVIKSGATNTDTLLIAANDTTFITLTTNTTDVCELDACTLDTSIAKGTWTASGTWTLPAMTWGGAISCGDQSMTGVGDMTFTAGKTITGASVVVEAHTSNSTLTLAESGSVHTNLGDTGAQNIRLPNSATAGVYFTFALQVAQEINVLIHAGGGKIYHGGVIHTDDGGNDLEITADDEGESITLMSDGAGGWFVTAETGTWTVSQP